MHEGKRYFQRKTGSLIEMLESGQSRSNAQVIVGLGIPEQDFLEHHREIGFRMVELLGIDMLTKLTPQFQEWMEDITAHIKKEISPGT